MITDKNDYHFHKDCKHFDECNVSEVKDGKRHFYNSNVLLAVRNYTTKAIFTLSSGRVRSLSQNKRQYLTSCRANMDIQAKMEEYCYDCKHYKAEIIEKGLSMNICELVQEPEWNEEQEACECEYYEPTKERW